MCKGTNSNGDRKRDSKEWKLISDLRIDEGPKCNSGPRQKGEVEDCVENSDGCRLHEI